MIPVSISGGGSATSSLTTPEALRQRLEGAALDQGRGDDDEEDDVEDQGRVADAGDDREGREPDRDRAAEAGPAEHQPLAVVKRRERAGDERGERAGDEDQHDGDQQRLAGVVVEPTGEDQQPEQHEERDLGDPREALVEGDRRLAGGDRPGAEDQGDDVDRQKAGPVDELGHPVGERRGGDRRHRVQPGARQVDPADAPPGAEPDRDAEGEPDRELHREAGDHVGEAVVRHLDPVDEPGDEQQRDRVVHAGLALERPREAFAQVRAAQDGEDRRAVGRRHRGADQQSLEGREIEQPDRGQAGDHRCDHGADRRQRDRGPEHRADLVPARGEAALEEDQRRGRSSPACGPARSC